MAVRTDSAILHEIVRIIRERAQVPEKVRIRTKQFVITYLEDHRQRLEEAMRRHDSDRVEMLFGQLPGRIKYQLLKPSRRPGAKTTRKPAPAKSRSKPAAKAKSPAKGKAKTAARAAGKRRARA